MLDDSTHALSSSEDDSRSPNEDSSKAAGTTLGTVARSTLVDGELPEESALFGRLPPADREFLVRCRLAVARRVSITTHTGFSMGDDLIAAKLKLRGVFIEWVKAVLPCTERTAQNQMRIARTWVGEELRETISYLDVTTLYGLSGKHPLLAELRAAVLAEIEAGSPPTSSNVERRIAEIVESPESKPKKTARAKKATEEKAEADCVSAPSSYNLDEKTEAAVETIFESVKHEAESLLPLLTAAKAAFVGPRLIERLTEHSTYVDTPYRPIRKAEIENEVQNFGYIGK